MRARQLREVLYGIVAIGLPSSGCLVTDLVTSNDDCVEVVHKSLHIEEPADPPMQLRIDSCRLDVDACRELCIMAMQRADIGAAPSACEVTFLGNDVTAEVAYEVYHDGPHCPVDGRRPAGLAAVQRVTGHGVVGAWLAQAAWLEAASIHAFVRLARELAAHRAPRSLIARALAAADDEVRHTTMMTALARRHGATVPVPVVAPPTPRSLEALALENMVEGCVRETWAAVIALWQAGAAPDPGLRATFAAIAGDEVRHAALAWAIDAWVRPQLDDFARARIDLARDAAAAALAAVSEPGALVTLGMPTAADVRGLHARTNNALWMGGRS
jgi:hypothetical protein